jgi:hypothetical protein
VHVREQALAIEQGRNSSRVQESLQQMLESSKASSAITHELCILLKVPAAELAPGVRKRALYTRKRALYQPQKKTLHP